MVRGGKTINRARQHRVFITNNTAISEEFTSLPALMIVMISFTLFIIVLVQSYASYQNRLTILNNFEIADFLSQKICNPENVFIREGGLLDLPVLISQENREKLNQTRQKYQTIGKDFTIRIRWDTGFFDVPISMPPNNSNQIAITHDISLYFNPAITSIGKITIIIWDNNQHITEASYFSTSFIPNNLKIFLLLFFLFFFFEYSIIKKEKKQR